MSKWIFGIALFFVFEVRAAELYYLRSESIDLKLIPSPPVMDSSADLEDLKNVMDLQKIRTQAQCARASIEAEGFATSFFGDGLGPLTNAEAKRLVDFQERLFNEVNFYARILKLSFARSRPFDRDSNIVPCIPIHRSNSFPSGHAAVSYVAAKTFSIIYPEKEASFIKRANEISFGRVLGGVHHPTDTAAGKILGEEIFKALMLEKKFRNDVKALTP